MKLKNEFSFDAAHRLVGYKGLCSNLHGHIWRVEIEVTGNKIDDVRMIWDFTNVKELKNMFDHKTILKECKENDRILTALETTCGVNSVYLMQENPTAENLCQEILEYLKNNNSPMLKFKVIVWESPKSSCEVSG